LFSSLFLINKARDVPVKPWDAEKEFSINVLWHGREDHKSGTVEWS